MSEPSRLAHLGIATTTAVVTDHSVPVAMFTAPMPNPFQSATSVRYALPDPTRLRATVYNVEGAMVRSLVDAAVPGSGTVTWDGTTASGRRAPRGVYLLDLEAAGFRETRKAVLVE